MEGNSYLVPSDKIEVFPIAKTRQISNGTIQQNGRLLYEDNIANIIRQVIDTNGFIISGGSIVYNEESKESKLSEDLIFNLYGYNVKIKSGFKLPDLESNYIIATVAFQPLEIGDSSSVLKELLADEIEGEGDGEKSYYKGIYLVTTDELPSQSSNDIFITLFKKYSDDLNKSVYWKICDDSYIKFDFTSLGITGIDGKR